MCFISPYGGYSGHLKMQFISMGDFTITNSIEKKRMNEKHTKIYIYIPSN